MSPRASETFVTVEGAEALNTFLSVLGTHPCLRAIQLVSSTRVEEGDDDAVEGYDARAVFQSDNLASQPLEVELRGVRELNLRADGHIRATGSGRLLLGIGVELDFDTASLTCSALRYRMMPRGAAMPGTEGSVSLH